MGGVAESLISAARQRKLDFAFAGNYTHLFLADDDRLIKFSIMGTEVKDDRVTRYEKYHDVALKQLSHHIF
jgi:hypothetical protein